VTKKGEYAFRVCFIDPFQGEVIAKFVASDLKKKTAVLFIDTKSDYSVGLAQFFKTTFENLGGKVIGQANYQSGDMDFKAQLTDLKSKGADIVVLPGYYTEVGLILKQARELGITVPFIGGDGWDSPKLVGIGGKALEGSYFSNHYSSDDTDPKVQAFVTRYQKLYKETPDSMAALGYDAGLILFDAIKRAPNSSHQALRDAIAQTKNFVGVTGKITIDANRNASKPAVILEIENGRYKFVKRVEP
jgi:branched-chain amino acid transport system substrate-binding protein